MSLPLVILTACVDPMGCCLLRRADPVLRLADYEAALRMWLGTPYPLLFVENSGAPLGGIPDLIAAHRDRAELLQFSGNRYPRHLGKGYGEMEIISYAMDHSIMIRQHPRLVKVTGRLFVRNHVVLSGAGHRRQRRNRSEVFACDHPFLRSLLALHEHLDDSLGVYFEHAMAEAASAYPFVRFDQEPVLCGHHASTGRSCRYPLDGIAPDLSLHEMM